MNKKQILLINDMAGYGKVATAAMLPILSYMGLPTYNLPTALVSNTQPNTLKAFSLCGKSFISPSMPSQRAS